MEEYASREQVERSQDILLNKLRWKTAHNEFSSWRCLRLDCFKYIFTGKGLSQEQQEKLLNYMGDAEQLNKITPMDFCVWFRQNSIECKLKYAYTRKRGVRYNIACFTVIQAMKKIVNA